VRKAQPHVVIATFFATVTEVADVLLHWQVGGVCVCGDITTFALLSLLLLLCLACGRKMTKMYVVPAELQI